LCFRVPAKNIPSPQWRECIKKVWELDPFHCPKCGSEMKIISFINEDNAIRSIIEKNYEPYDEGWAQYEELSFMIH